eukprot:SAG11_NODE_8218_length_1045_cov_9.433404_2_plen_72_part_00
MSQQKGAQAAGRSFQWCGGLVGTIDGWLKRSSGVNRVNAVAEGVLSNVDSESYPDRVLSIFNAYVADTEDF